MIVRHQGIKKEADTTEGKKAIVDGEVLYKTRENQVKLLIYEAS